MSEPKFKVGDRVAVVGVIVMECEIHVGRFIVQLPNDRRIEFKADDINVNLADKPVGETEAERIYREALEAIRDHSTCNASTVLAVKSLARVKALKEGK